MDSYQRERDCYDFLRRWDVCLATRYYGCIELEEVACLLLEDLCSAIPFEPGLHMEALLRSLAVLHATFMGGATRQAHERPPLSSLPPLPLRSVEALRACIESSHSRARAMGWPTSKGGLFLTRWSENVVEFYRRYRSRPDAICCAKTTLVHRDLKPSNIFVTREGVKAIDWDLAGPGTASEDVAYIIAKTANTHDDAIQTLKSYSSLSNNSDRTCDFEEQVYDQLRLYLSCRMIFHMNRVLREPGPKSLLKRVRRWEFLYAEAGLL